MRTMEMAMKCWYFNNWISFSKSTNATILPKICPSELWSEICFTIFDRLCVCMCACVVCVCACIGASGIAHHTERYLLVDSAFRLEVASLRAELEFMDWTKRVKLGQWYHSTTSLYYLKWNGKSVYTVLADFLFFDFHPKPKPKIVKQMTNSPNEKSISRIGAFGAAQWDAEKRERQNRLHTCPF